MKRLVVGLMLAAVGATALMTAQGAPTPFKVGTFERQGRTFVGVVLRDSVVVDFAAANAAIKTPSAKVAAPTDMKDLIVRYESGVRDRIMDILRAVGDGRGAARPEYVYDVSALRTMPPIMYPMTMLNMAVNYREHAVEMAGRGSQPPAQPGAPAPGSAPPGTRSAPGIWERAANDTRWNPYMFPKAVSSIIADAEAIRVPVGRHQVDWECELAVVIGRRASRVPAARANDYIFGYTIENDVSDRGGRGDDRFGSDWLIGKSHDTFAPMGPFIIPKEFVRDPRNLPVKFMLNGQLMQDANSSLMIHDVFEQVAYASNVLTLRPGDVISTGSPAGVGSARKPPIFLKPGDRAVCTYEGIGTLSNPVLGPDPVATRN